MFLLLPSSTSSNLFSSSFSSLVSSLLSSNTFLLTSTDSPFEALRLPECRRSSSGARADLIDNSDVAARGALVARDGSGDVAREVDSRRELCDEVEVEVEVGVIEYKDVIVAVLEAAIDDVESKMPEVAAREEEL